MLWSIYIYIYISLYNQDPGAQGIGLGRDHPWEDRALQRAHGAHWDHGTIGTMGPWDHWDHGTIGTGTILGFLSPGVRVSRPPAAKGSQKTYFLGIKTLKVFKKYIFFSDFQALEFG